MTKKEQEIVNETFEEIIDRLEIMAVTTESEKWHNNEAKKSVVTGIKLSIGKIERIRDGKVHRSTETKRSKV